MHTWLNSIFDELFWIIPFRKIFFGVKVFIDCHINIFSKIFIAKRFKLRLKLLNNL